MMQTISKTCVFFGMLVSVLFGLIVGPASFFISLALVAFACAAFATIYEGCYPDDFVGVGEWQIHLAEFLRLR